MAKFTMTTLIQPYDIPDTARIGTGTDTGQVTDAELNKLHKLGGDSRYTLCAEGDAIEGQLVALEAATLDDYSIGTIKKKGRMDVVLDGLQATPGTGAIAIGDYVVCGTVVAKGTALSTGPKVCKATWQPGVTETTAVGDVNEQLKVVMFPWRLVSASGTTVGSTGVIERV